MYEDKCSVTYETEYEESCTTQNEEKCEVGKHKHERDYAKVECYKMFILQTVYDTVTEQKCETKARVQQQLINGIFCPEERLNPPQCTSSFY